MRSARSVEKAQKLAASYHTSPESLLTILEGYFYSGDESPSNPAADKLQDGDEEGSEPVSLAASWRWGLKSS